mgnify:CR=1 FL=1
MKLVTKLVKAIILSVLIALSVGCSTTPIRTTPIIEQEALLQRCPQETPIPTGTDGKSLLDALIAFQVQYTQCATRHDELINTITILKNTKKVDK